MANAYYSDISDFLDYATKKTNQLITEENQQGLQKFVNELIQLADDVTELAEGVPARWEQYQAMLRQKDMMVQTINAQKAQIEELNKMMASDFGNATSGPSSSDIGDIDADALASEFVDMDDDESPFDFGDSGIEIDTPDDGDDSDYTGYSTDLDELVGIADGEEEDVNDEQTHGNDDLPSADDFGDYDADGIDIDIPDTDADDNGNAIDNSDYDSIQQPINTGGLSELGFDDLEHVTDAITDDDDEVETPKANTPTNNASNTKGRLTRQDTDSDDGDDEDDDDIDFTIDEDFLDF